MTYDATKALPKGTLLLEPGDRPAIWTVVSAKKIVRVSDKIIAEATLTKPGIPKDWQVIDNRALALHLSQLAGHDRAFPTGRILYGE